MNAASAPVLTATRLRFAYGHQPVLDGVTVTITPGTRLAVIGPNGAGKSTLLRLLSGTLRPADGRIVWRGRDITRWSPARRARAGIAVTSQTPAVMSSLTVVDNLVAAGWPHLPGRWKAGHRRELTRRALHQLDQLGLVDHAQKPAGSLSHGHRRMLDLGMSLTARPSLLLLDEPAAGLGDTDLDRLLHVLDSLPSDMAVVLVEHHHGVVAAVADTVTVLHHGRVLVTGTPAQIAADPLVAEVYAGTTLRRVPR